MDIKEHGSEQVEETDKMQAGNDKTVPATPVPMRRSNRQRRPTQCMLESIEQQDVALVAFESLAPRSQPIDKGIADPIAFAASADPDIMYFNKAMQQHDCEKFVEAMVQEFNLHTVGAHWRLVPKTVIQTWNKLVPAIWAMHRKHCIDTRKVYKWKARLNMHS